MMFKAVKATLRNPNPNALLFNEPLQMLQSRYLDFQGLDLVES